MAALPIQHMVDEFLMNFHATYYVYIDILQSTDNYVMYTTIRSVFSYFVRGATMLIVKLVDLIDFVSLAV